MAKPKKFSEALERMAARGQKLALKALEEDASKMESR
jgi:hypothetical protein